MEMIDILIIKEIIKVREKNNKQTRWYMDGDTNILIKKGLLTSIFTDLYMYMYLYREETQNVKND